MMTLIDTLAKYPVQTIEINGQLQAYREAGQGQTLILLHGISSGSASWVNQLDVLSHHFHVIAWDAPGYGLSENLDTEQPNATDYAQRVLAIMDALAISKAIIVGHSVYQKRPNMLKSLGNAGMATSRGPHLIYKQDPQALALVSEVMGQLTLDGFTRASYLLAYDEIRNYLTDIKVACVVIAGDKDEITPAQAIMELAMEMQLSRCHLITDAGHLSYVDQPDQFNDIVLSAN